MDRCTGHCCKRFMLPVSLAELRAEVKRIRKNDDIDIYDAGVVLDMVKPLGLSDRDNDGSKIPKKVEWFTCRHLHENGDCGIYEQRPSMCREYPIGPCKIPECTYTAVKLNIIADRSAG